MGFVWEGLWGVSGGDYFELRKVPVQGHSSLTLMWAFFGWAKWWDL